MQSLRAEEMRLITFLHFSHLAPESMHGRWAGQPLCTSSHLFSARFFAILEDFLGNCWCLWRGRGTVYKNWRLFISAYLWLVMTMIMYVMLAIWIWCWRNWPQCIISCQWIINVGSVGCWKICAILLWPMICKAKKITFYSHPEIYSLTEWTQSKKCNCGKFLRLECGCFFHGTAPRLWLTKELWASGDEESVVTF